MSECKSGQCGLKSAQEESKEASCGCESGSCQCGCGCGCGCDCGCGCSDVCCGKTDKLVLLAEAAHTELLKQKMKAAFEAKIGKKMDKVANLAVDAALDCLKSKMAKKQAHEDFETALMNIFKGN